MAANLAAVICKLSLHDGCLCKAKHLLQSHLPLVSF